MGIFVGGIISCDSCGAEHKRGGAYAHELGVSARSRGWIERIKSDKWQWICPACLKLEAIEAQQEAARLAQRWEPAADEDAPDGQYDDRWHAMKRD